MVESQAELNANRIKQLETFSELLPGVWSKVTDLASEVYKDGALSSRVKRLMALAVALGAGCHNCILSQTMYSLENGASVNEILETISVVMTIRGTTGGAESLRVIQLLDELGKL